VFVELPKFKAKNLTETKMPVLWLRFLTEIAPNGADEVSQDLLDNPQTGEALEIVRASGLNDAERAAYEGFWDRVSIEATKKAYMDKAIAERDAANARAAAANAERDAANAERDAAMETLRQTVCGLKDIGMPIDQIAKVTGLKADEVEAVWGCVK
jgi:hypothetical protein